MALLPILLHPDPVLRAVAQGVERFDEALAQLVEDMFDTMYAAPGRGLAAPQIGRSIRLFVMDVAWKEAAPEPRVFVNPEVTALEEAPVTGIEGCLSIPGRVSHVPRAPVVRVRWQDQAGTAHEAQFEGMAAICIQHEADHLDGVLCIDREVAPPEAP